MRALGGTLVAHGHLAAVDAAERAGAGAQPLHVAATETRGGPQGVGMVDQALAHDGHRLEAAMRMVGRPDRLTGLDVIITRLSHGVPVGGELELLDDGTLLAALSSRRPF